MRWWNPAAALAVVVWASSLTRPAGAQGVRQAVEAKGETEASERLQAQSYAGITLTCQPSENGREYACHRERPAEPLGFRDHLGRFVHRFVRDPIAVLTLALFFIGGWQVEISRRTARRQLRAYMFPDNVGISDGTNLPAGPSPLLDPGHARTLIIIKNTGQTPAYKLRHWAEIAIRRTTEEHTLIAPKKLAMVSVSTIAAQGFNTKYLMMSRVPTVQEIAEIQTFVSALYVYGRIEYEDAFKRRRFANYRLKYFGAWPPPPSATMTFCDEGNDAD